MDRIFVGDLQYTYWDEFKPSTVYGAWYEMWHLFLTKYKCDL